MAWSVKLFIYFYRLYWYASQIYVFAHATVCRFEWHSVTRNVVIQKQTNKINKAAWLVSNCNAPNKREQYVKQLQR